MIHYRGMNIAAVRYVSSGIEKAFAALYVGANLVWMAIRSCFGSGRWIDNKPWIDKEMWKD